MDLAGRWFPDVGWVKAPMAARTWRCGIILGRLCGSHLWEPESTLSVAGGVFRPGEGDAQGPERASWR